MAKIYIAGIVHIAEICVPTCFRCVLGYNPHKPLWLLDFWALSSRLCTYRPEIQVYQPLLSAEECVCYPVPQKEWIFGVAFAHLLD